MANLEKFYIPQYDKAGIYAVVNRTKMTAYVGQSTNIKKRALQHKTGIQNGTHNVKEINEDKEDEFTFLVLHKFYNEEVAKSKLDFTKKFICSHWQKLALSYITKMMLDIIKIFLILQHIFAMI